jgi:hypothetical protein
MSLGITRVSPENLVWSFQDITMNDILTENQTISSHLCENRMWEPIFKRKKIWESGKDQGSTPYLG